MNQGLRELVRPLLYLVLFNLAPQFYLRPFWIAAFSFSLVGFRLWIEVTKRSVPPRWLMLPLQAVIALAIWQQYHSYVGDEAGGAFLTLLACLKVFELHKPRDFFVTVILCVLVMMSYLLLDQGLIMTLYMLVDIVALSTFLYALQNEHWDWKQWRQMVTPNLAIALKALPLVVLMFVLFPRFNTGFGRGGDSKAKTGITDTLRPGAISELASSDELVFRASFLDGVVPPKSQLYWRAVVLDVSKGMNWDRSKPNTTNFRMSEPPVNPDLEIYLEPGSERYLFSLENTSSLGFPSTSGVRSLIREGRTYELGQPLQTRARYYIERQQEAIKGLGDPEDYLQVEEKASPELTKFLAKFRGQSDAETVRMLLDHFKDGGYRYSMKPPASASLDEFFFKNKIGFCEHYSGTMATLLRNLKIPARVVVGFQGGNNSFFENYISVRGHDAHSWIEYYDRGVNRWRRVDPTSQVQPLRLIEGSNALFEEGQALMPKWMPTGWYRSFLKSRAFVDEVEANWIGFLLRFDLARQKELLASLGMEEVLFRALGVFLVLSVGLILAVFYFLEAQRRAPLTPDEKLYRQLIMILRKWKIQKLPQEGPRALLEKVRAVNARLAEVMEPTLTSLVEIRYGRVKLSQAKSREIQRGLRELRKFRP